MSDAVLFAAVALCVSLTGLACLLFGFDELVEEWFERGVRFDYCTICPLKGWLVRGHWEQRHRSWARFIVLRLPCYSWEPHICWDTYGWCQMHVRWVEREGIQMHWIPCEWDKPPHR